jgi:hypothetical protein
MVSDTGPVGDLIGSPALRRKVRITSLEIWRTLPTVGYFLQGGKDGIFRGGRLRAINRCSWMHIYISHRAFTFRIAKNKSGLVFSFIYM